MSDVSEPSLEKPLRAGLAHKRAAILAAARELFVRNGVERTSMDAVAAAAAVSKRTIYDYYGDKRRLLLGVIEEAGNALLLIRRKGIADHLSEVADIDDLQRALTAFAVEVGGQAVASTDYAATVKLITENEALLPELEGHPLDVAHTAELAERFAHFAAQGLLEVDDAQRAAEQFEALTTLLAYNQHVASRANPARIRQIMVDGVRAFVRAYRTR